MTQLRAFSNKVEALLDVHKSPSYASCELTKEKLKKEYEELSFQLQRFEIIMTDNSQAKKKSMKALKQSLGVLGMYIWV